LRDRAHSRAARRPTPIRLALFAFSIEATLPQVIVLGVAGIVA
jgi:hypothetical protein